MCIVNVHYIHVYSHIYVRAYACVCVNVCIHIHLTYVLCFAVSQNSSTGVTPFDPPSNLSEGGDVLAFIWEIQLREFMVPET